MLPEVEAYIKQRDLRTALIGEKESIKDAVSRQTAEAELQRDKETNIIKDRCFEEIERIYLKAKALTEPIEQGVRELDPKIYGIDRKIEFLNHREKNREEKLGFDDEAVEPHRDRELVKLGVLYEDEFTTIKLFAAENDRPKNRWTLLAIGDTLLRELVNMPRTYGLPVHTHRTYAAVQIGLKYLPTLEEIKVYAETKRGSLMQGHLVAYEAVKEAYLDTINNYSLEDFKPLLEPRKVSDTEVPVTFRTTGIGYSLEYRLYNGFYYRSGGEVDDKPFNCIEVDDMTYVRYCRPEQLRITETGNTMFGDWWSISIENDPRGIVFNRENWEKTITEAAIRIEELNVDRRKPVSFHHDKVEWVTSIPDDLFSTPKL